MRFATNQTGALEISIPPSPSQQTTSILHTRPFLEQSHFRGLGGSWSQMHQILMQVKLVGPCFCARRNSMASLSSWKLEPPHQAFMSRSTVDVTGWYVAYGHLDDLGRHHSPICGAAQSLEMVAGTSCSKGESKPETKIPKIDASGVSMLLGRSCRVKLCTKYEVLKSNTSSLQ
jgi:hypothetical protein